MRLLAGLVALVVVLAGCAGRAPLSPPLSEAGPAGAACVVDAKDPWTATDLLVEPGEVVEVSAAGSIRFEGFSFFGRQGRISGGPEGTYDYPDEATYRDYPLAAAGHGPTAPFGLIGRIGDDGEPFPVGRHRVLTADRAGRLHLGVNDYDFSDNDGAFHAVARVLDPATAATAAAGPLDARGVLAGEGDQPRPGEDTRVLMLFVDGLHYDVLVELALTGYLPNFRRIFLDGGLDIGPTFTVAPSNTIVATTAGLTGSWPDRTGLFTQLVFDRRSGTINYLATPEGPAKAVERIGQSWWEAPRRADDRPPLLKRRVETAGRRFRSTVIPVMPDYPPDRYVQRLANEMPLLGAHRVKDSYFDRAETAYAVDEVLQRDARVMFVYYAGVDTATHRSPRGPFGEARRDLVRIDQDLARLERELGRKGIADRTYWVLYADHGSTGGRDWIPQSWDVAGEFFYQWIVDADGDRRPDRDGGLGMNVLYQLDDVTLKRVHSDASSKDFAVCVAQAYSAAWVGLPRGSFESRDWSSPNSLFELRDYRTHPDFEPVDIVGRLLEATSARGNQNPAVSDDHPVAFALVPMPPDRVWVLARDSTAVVERRAAPGKGPRRFEYRYRLVSSVRRDGNTMWIRDEKAPRRDPFGYLDEPSMLEAGRAQAEWLGAWHDDTEWLEATAETSHPDAVVAYAHALLNDPDQPRFEDRARYDMLLVAGRGWNFGPAGHAATPDHGGPSREEKRIPFFVSGPGLVRGARVERPSRILDVLPTVLGMAAVDYDPASIDGRAVREIWAAPSQVRTVTPRPVEAAWDRGLRVPETDHEVSRSAVGHDSRAWYDLHNVFANVASLSQQEVLRLADRTIDTALIPGPERRPIGSGITAVARAWAALPDHRLRRRPAELLNALQLHNITIGEFTNPTQSLQHIDRIAMTIDWTRSVLNDPFGKAWPDAFTPMTPVDLTLKQLSRGLRGAKGVLLEWLTRSSNALIDGMEGGLRRTRDAVGPRPWRTPRVAPAGPRAGG